jgi:hypothetical protein
MCVATLLERHLFILIPTNDWRKGASGDRAGPKPASLAQILITPPCPTTNMC